MPDRARSAFELALRGEFAPARQWLADRPGQASAAHVALGTVVQLARGEALMACDFTALRAAGENEYLLAQACAYHQLAAVLRFDHVDAERLAREPTDSLHALRALLWVDYMRGGLVLEGCEEMGELARVLKAPAERIESTVLSALATLFCGELEAAMGYARRAARMARAEGLIHHEYLANIVLARARRKLGQPHLAARILAGLARVMPLAWHRWLDWETALCGADTKVNGFACQWVGAALDAASRGDRRHVDESIARLGVHVRGVAPFTRELGELHDALDPERPTDDSHLWARGDADRIWDTLKGTEQDESSPTAYVHVQADGAARRILGVAAGLVSSEVPCIRSIQRKDARVMRFAAVIALAGPHGIDEAELFERVYGFAYDRAKHESTARVLVHRARALFAEHASVERQGRRLHLMPSTPLLIVDPRCARSVEQRVMRLLGSRAEHLKAAEIAEVLGISVRQVQRALKSLQQRGACSSAGRHGGYHIEDTTFREPTRSRVLSG